MPQLTIKEKVAEYKHDIAQLERIVKQWEEEFKIKQISRLADACYGAFNNLQMSIAKIQDTDQKKKHDLDCYNGTYQFLVFVETKVDTDFCVLLMNKCKSFSNLITHYSKYCSDMENKYNIELNSEKIFQVSRQTTTRLKTVRKK